MVIDTTKDNSFDSSTDAVVPQHKQLYRGEKKIRPVQYNYKFIHNKNKWPKEIILLSQVQFCRKQKNAQYVDGQLCILTTQALFSFLFI